MTTSLSEFRLIPGVYAEVYRLRFALTSYAWYFHCLPAPSDISRFRAMHGEDPVIEKFGWHLETFPSWMEIEL